MREREIPTPDLQFQSPWHRILAGPGPFLVLKKKELFSSRKMYYCLFFFFFFNGGLNLGSLVETYSYTWVIKQHWSEITLWKLQFLLKLWTKTRRNHCSYRSWGGKLEIFVFRDFYPETAPDEDEECNFLPCVPEMNNSMQKSWF